jgi:TolB-like protein
MATKTFKIGEYAIGGIIRVQTDKTRVEVKALDWNTNEVLQSASFDLREMDVRYKVNEKLNELTSSYHAEKVLSWIESKVKFTNEFSY